MTTEAGEGLTLFSGVNWLGDSIMTMPAIHEFKRRHPANTLTMLTKPSLTLLWRLNPDIDRVVELHPGPLGAARASIEIRKMRVARAFVLTQSFRSALVPFLARIPERTGMPGHFRDWMLTGIVKPDGKEARKHQMFEYFDLLGLADSAKPSIPSIRIPDELTESCKKRLFGSFPNGNVGSIAGMLPGAAHGPSKCWPAGNFREVARRLTDRPGCKVAVFGSQGESAACAAIAADMEGKVVDLSGKTSIPELAAMLALCNVVLANDSGGMHLAAMVGTPVVAIFGLTDPSKTGPLGQQHRILAADLAHRSRDVAPDCQAATAALLSIRTETVFQAILDILGTTHLPRA
ncbi:MAG: lipopolysaccharide heptosyltransferase II [bacterium]